VGTGDIPGNVEGRMNRQGVLLDQSKQFTILMTEAWASRFTPTATTTPTLVLVELVPEELTLSEPDDVALYLREFDRLRSAALFGDQAHALLDRIAEDMHRDASLSHKQLTR
jgi:hypothetical protein